MQKRIGTRPALAGLVLIVGLAVPAAPALAQGEEGSAFDQYIENVPGPRGEKPTHEALQGDGDPLAPGAADALRELGPAGEQTARVAEILTGNARRDQADRDRRAPERTSEGGLEAALGEFLGFDGEGLGFVLPLILAGTLIAGLAFALSRRLDKGEAA